MPTLNTTTAPASAANFDTTVSSSVSSATGQAAFVSALNVKTASPSWDSYHIDSCAWENMGHTTHRFLAKFADCRPLTVGEGQVPWSTHVSRLVADQLTHWHQRLGHLDLSEVVKIQQGSAGQRVGDCIQFDLGLCSM
jgi:hypothetical protein